MSFDVSEFARPVRIADAQDLKGLSDADMQRVALGTPIAIGQRYSPSAGTRRTPAPN